MATSGPRFDPDEYHAALRAAGERIVPSAQGMTLEDAREIVRMEFARRGVPLSTSAEKAHARFFDRGFFWRLLHPRQPRREGIHFSWRWSRDDSDRESAPVAVHNLADHEAWRLTGRAFGPLSEGLLPADCRRVSQTEYSRVAHFSPSPGEPTHRVEIRISCRRGGSPRVLDAVLKQD